MNSASTVFCTRCGNQLVSTFRICPSCGNQEFSAAPVVTRPAQAFAGAQSAGVGAFSTSLSQANSGGFWRRVAAFFIDTIVYLIFMFLFLIFLAFCFAILTHNSNDDLSDYAIGILLTPGFDIFSNILSTVVQWLYFAIQESSSVQATLGKRAFGMKVITLDGNRISFGRATGRYFAKYISALLLGIGFLLVAFTRRKQGLHDTIAGTLVIVS